MARKKRNRFLAYVKSQLHWLPLIGILWGVVSYSVSTAMVRFAAKHLVPVDTYIESQHTQDERISRLEREMDAMMEKK